MPERNAPVPPVRRRISPVDPAPGAWAVIGLGSSGEDVATRLQSAGVAVLGYDRGPARPFAAPARWEHEVIGVDEIDDMDLLAVTSRDRATGEINTDYFAGVVLATTQSAYIDPEVLNVHAGHPVLAHHTFTPRHPALVVADRTPGTDPRAAVIARYAVALRDDPRRALAFHRHVCARIIPGWPETSADPDDGRDPRELLEADLVVLG